MNTILGWMAQNAVLTALLVPVVALACKWFRDRPAVQHLLWAMVLVKLMTPPVAPAPWSLPDSWTAMIMSPFNASMQTPKVQADVLGEAPIAQQKIVIAIDSLPPAIDTGPVGEPAAVGWNINEFAWFALVGVWLTGAGVCALRHGRQIAQYATVVRAGRAAPDGLVAEVNAVAAELGMNAPRTVVSAGILSPFVWCLGRLRMVWPALMLGDADIARSRGVIAHELAHLRRRDHWMTWLEFFAGIVWWWNPIYWFIRRRIRETSEMACDALAIAIQPENRREYAEMLLEISAGSSAWGGKTGVPAPVLGVSAGTPSSFERRLFMICSDRVSGKMTLAGVFFALGIAAASLPGRPLDPPMIVAADEPAAAQNVDPAEPEKVPQPKPAADPLRGGGLEKRVEVRTEGNKTIKLIDGRIAEIVTGTFVDGDGGTSGSIQLNDAPGLKAKWVGLVLVRPQPLVVKQLQLPKDRGLVVVQVQGDSPASKAGIQLHDILLKIGDKEIPSDVTKLAQEVDVLKPNTEADVLVLRNGKKEVVGLKVHEAKQDVLIIVGQPGVALNEGNFSNPIVSGGKITFVLEPGKNNKTAPISGNSTAKPPTGLPGGAAASGSVSGFATGGVVDGKATAKAGVGTSGNAPLVGSPSTALPTSPGGKIAGGGIAKSAASGGGAEATSVSVNNDEFTIKHSSGSLKVSIAGKRDNGQATPTEITIEDEGTTVRAQSLQQVPQRFLPVVNRLLENVK